MEITQISTSFEKNFNNRAVPTFGNVIVLAVLLISMDKTMFAIRWFLWWKDLPCDEKQDLGEGGTQCIGPFVIHNFAQKHTTCKIRLAFLFCISICICQLRIRSQTQHYTTCICIFFPFVSTFNIFLFVFHDITIIRLWLGTTGREWGF